MIRPRSSRRPRPARLPLILTLAAIAFIPTAAAGPVLQADLADFRIRHGSGWSLRADPATGRPRSLIGGSIAWIAPGDLRALTPDERSEALLDSARQFLADNEALLGVTASDLAPSPGSPVVIESGRFAAIHFDVAPHGVPVLGSRVTLSVSRGNLIGVHAVGTAPVAQHQAPRILGNHAAGLAIDVAGTTAANLEAQPDPLLAWSPENGSHRLVWRVTIIERNPPRRLVILVDAVTSDIVSVSDETVQSCDPPMTSGGLRRVLGGVRPERADDPERQELLRLADVDGTPSGPDGFFVPPGPTYGGTLTGPAVTINCTSCTNPTAPTAVAGSDGDVDFGSGGLDGGGNGTSTPSDRACYFHVEAVQRQADRWLPSAWVTATLPVNTNLLADCNAYWNGSSINFYRGSSSCSNTGEIADVIAHEWGHGLDDNDGLPTPGLSVDGATGEAVGDIVAILRFRDACIGESFFLDPSRWPSDNCSGVRDVDEKAAGHRRGLVTTANVASRCNASAFYRGPLGRQGHCEGQILGQAFWHLVQNLVGGVSYSDGTPLPDGALPTEHAWDVAEQLFYTSRPIVASYAPMAMQSIGMGAHEAFLLVDDEGDGVANGTPHAAAIHEAFVHHGIEEQAMAPADTTGCVVTDPVVTVDSSLDAQSGRTALTVTWTDTGATAYHVLRADDPDDAYLRIHADTAAGSFVDRAVLPDRDYRYRVVAEDATGCLSPGATFIDARPGAWLVVAGVTVDDSGLGNGNGILEIGEEVDLLVDVMNVGTADATNLSMEIMSADPALVVTVPGPLMYGTVAGGATVSGPGPFRVRADPGAGRFVVVEISGEADNACLNGYWNLEIGVPDLVKAGESLVDAGLDGQWDPGENADLFIDLENLGLIDAVDVEATLSFRGLPVPGVTILQAVSRYDPRVVSRGPPVTGAPPYELMADMMMGPRTAVPLQLDVTIGGVAHRTFDVDVTVGGIANGVPEWSKHVQAGFSNLLAYDSPVVAQLTDDDGDGVITDCDIPDIVVVGFDIWDADRPSYLSAISGDTGDFMWVVTTGTCGEIWRGSSSAHAVGDLDGDGWNEIVVGGLDGRVCAFRSDGTPFWETANPVSVGTSPTAQKRVSLEMWDLDADGDVEVVAGGTVLRGVDGTVLWDRNVTNTGHATVADLDLDGQLEILLRMFGRTHAYRADGSPYVSTFGTLGFGTIVGQLDSDPFPEIVTIDWDDMKAFEHDGTSIWTTNLPQNTGHIPPRPCAGDFDGDGLTEIAQNQYQFFSAVDDDGSVMWTVPQDDISAQMAGCAVFDFDGDGPPEIVFMDREHLIIMDGVTGDRLWQAPLDASTLEETPVIADLDGDGAAEILQAGANATGMPGSIASWGSPDWPPARGVWNQVNYSINHVDEVGRIISDPVPSWLSHGTFRGQASICTCIPDMPAMTVRVPDCGNLNACFTLPASPDVDPSTIRWDFGDGSPEEFGASACHAYASTGSYLVRVTAVSTDPRATTCPLYTEQLLDLTNTLSVSVASEPACAGLPTCFTATVSNGLDPVELEWDFGDGSPRQQGAAVCHTFSGGSFDVTLLARDANGCLAEDIVPIFVPSPDVLPELSPPGSPDPLLVVRDRPSDLLITYEDGGYESHLYAGSIDQLRPSGYTHEAFGACRMTGGRATVAMPASNTYYLAVAASCDPTKPDGPFGRSSMMADRPSTSAIGRAGCP